MLVTTYTPLQKAMIHAVPRDRTYAALRALGDLTSHDGPSGCVAEPLVPGVHEQVGCRQEIYPDDWLVHVRHDEAPGKVPAQAEIEAQCDSAKSRYRRPIRGNQLKFALPWSRLR